MGAAVTGAQAGVASASAGGYGVNGFGADGYGMPSADDSVTVSTGNATDVGDNGATLGGTVVALGGASDIEVAFEWGPAGGDLGNTTAPQRLSATEDFDATIDGLSQGTEYEFRAVANGSTDRSDTGATVSFTTRRPAPSVGDETTLLPRDGEITNAWYDSNHEGYRGDGFVNFRQSDSAVQWDVDNEAADEFDLTVRYALDDDERTGQLTAAGSDTELTMASTGAWDTWETTTERVSLPEGTSTLRIAAAGEDLGNVDSIRVRRVETDTSTERTLLPRDGEITNAWYDSNHEGYQGDGFVNFRRSDSAVQWDVDNESAGEFDLTIRYALGDDERTGQLTAGDAQREVTVGSTGAWDTWETLTERVTLPAGSTTVRIEATGEDFGNVDAVSLVPAGDTASDAWSSKTLLPRDGEITDAWYDSNHEGYQGDGFVNFRQSDSAVQWDVDNEAADEFELTIRYALGDEDRTGRLTVGDAQREVTVRSTGEWTAWDTTTERVTLSEGSVTVRLEAIGEDFGNVDYVKLDRL